MDDTVRLATTRERCLEKVDIMYNETCHCEDNRFYYT